jgi:hypothetical protein
MFIISLFHSYLELSIISQSSFLSICSLLFFFFDCSFGQIYFEPINVPRLAPLFYHLILSWSHYTIIPFLSLSLPPSLSSISQSYIVIFQIQQSIQKPRPCKTWPRDLNLHRINGMSLEDYKEFSSDDKTTK